MATTQAGAATQHLTIRCQFCDTWNRVDAARAADRPKCGKCAKPMLLDRPFALNDETFARTIAETDVPVLVDFYADWCGPCKMMAPYVDELAREKQGVALVAKLDTDRAQRTASGFNIRGIPDDDRLQERTRDGAAVRRRPEEGARGPAREGRCGKRLTVERS